MAHDPKGVGERSEAQVIATFLKAGKCVLQPFGDNQRYDLVVDEGNGKFVRVQCKTARRFGEKEGVFEFCTCSNNWYSHTKRTYVGEIDVFAVYSPDLDRVLIFSINSTPKTSCCFRVESAIQSSTNRLLKNHEFTSGKSLFDYP